MQERGRKTNLSLSIIALFSRFCCAKYNILQHISPYIQKCVLHLIGDAAIDLQST